MMPHIRCALLPLVGRGWGGGHEISAAVAMRTTLLPSPPPQGGEGVDRVRRPADSTSRECALAQMLLEKLERQRKRALRLRLRVGLAAVAREGMIGAGIFVD